MASDKFKLNEEQLASFSGGLYCECEPESSFCPNSKKNGEHCWSVTKAYAEDFSVDMTCMYCGMLVHGKLHFG